MSNYTPRPLRPYAGDLETPQERDASLTEAQRKVRVDHLTGARRARRDFFPAFYAAAEAMKKSEIGKNALRSNYDYMKSTKITQAEKAKSQAVQFTPHAPIAMHNEQKPRDEFTLTLEGMDPKYRTGAPTPVLNEAESLQRVEKARQGDYADESLASAEAYGNVPQPAPLRESNNPANEEAARANVAAIITQSQARAAT